MYFHKIPVSLVLILVTLATLFHDSNAQNSPTDFVNAHNTPRAQVFPSFPTGTIIWNTTLANYALNYANSRAVTCSLAPSAGPYGENMAMGSGPAFTGVVAVGSWAAQISYYDYAANTCATGHICTHYTQVVWANSLQLGCARVLCSGGSSNYIVVCSYSAKGNVGGEWPY